MAKLLASAVLAFSTMMSPVEIPSPPPILVEEVATTTTPIVVQKKIQKTKNDCMKYLSIIEKYSWPVKDVLQICEDESSGDPKNINWNDIHKDSKGNVICVSSQGLMQVACFWPEKLGYEITDLLDPEKNIAMGHLIWLKSGFYPWTTYIHE